MMTTEKVVEAFAACLKLLEEEYNGEIPPIRIYSRNAFVEQDEYEDDVRLEHMAYLCKEGTRMAKEEPERREKVMRWLGFVQGYVWACRMTTVEELKDMNKPEPKVCGIPAAGGMIGYAECEMEWGHEGDMHANGGDGYYSRTYEVEHRRRQKEKSGT